MRIQISSSGIGGKTFLRKIKKCMLEHYDDVEFVAKKPDIWFKSFKNSQDPNFQDVPRIAIFSKSYDVLSNGTKVKQYYSQESVGIACGILITAIHNAGLVSLTHTPSPMNFLNEILGRPNNERPFLLLVVGYPAKDAKVPDIKKKKLEDIASFI